jgi:hypothetical protein
MILRKKVIQEIPVRYVEVFVPVDDDDMPEDAPGRDRGTWSARIDLDNHRVSDWPEGKTLSLFVAAGGYGSYVLLSEDLTVVAKIEEGYVPNSLFPRICNGDYLELEIDETGTITNWKLGADLSDFERE